MLEIKEEKFQLKVYGNDYEIDFPSGDQVDQMNESLAAPENKGRELKIMRKLFEDLGMPEEVLKRLQLKHYNQILESVLGKKN